MSARRKAMRCRSCSQQAAALAGTGKKTLHMLDQGVHHFAVNVGGTLFSLCGTRQQDAGRLAEVYSGDVS